MMFGTSVLAGVAVGGAIGLLLGGVALPLYWRLSEPRITSVNRTYRTTGIPTTPLDHLDPHQARAMVRRWQAMSSRSSSHIGLVAGDAKLEPLARQAAEWFAGLSVPAPQGAAADVALHGRPATVRERIHARPWGSPDEPPVLGTIDSSDPEAAQQARRSDVIVLVVRSTAPVAQVVERTRELGQLGHRPDWVLLVDSVKTAGRRARTGRLGHSSRPPGDRNQQRSRRFVATVTSMSKRPLSVAAFVLALAVLATSATPSFAAKRKVPFGFFGTVYNVEADRPSYSEASRDQQVDLMARSGVESMRVFLAWPAIEPGPEHLQLGPHRPRGGRRARGTGSRSWERPQHARMGLLAPERRVPPARPTEGPGPVRRVPPHPDRALRAQGHVLGGQPEHSQGADPQLADLERADGALVLGQQALGPQLREDAEGHLPGDPQGRSRGQGGGGLVRGDRQLHPVGRYPRHVQGGRQGLLRRDLGPPVQQHPEFGERLDLADARDRRRGCAQ